MINFKIFAPGRIVLSGEHSAAYGKQFIVASLDRYTTLEFYELPEQSGNIRIELLDVNLELNISLEEVRNYFYQENLSYMQSDSINLLKYVKDIITIKGMWKTNEQRFSLQMFFFLLYSIYYHEHFEMKPFAVKVSSELPIGVGLGSSSSFAVCLSACFLHLQRLQCGDHIEFDNNELLAIENYATSCEELMQDYGFASIDNDICINGNMKICRRINFIRYSQQFINMEKMKILLIDSNIRQTKCERATQMARLKHLISEFEFLLTKLDEIATAMYNTFISINHTVEKGYFRRREILYNDLQFHIRTNQQMLSDYHLSSSEFDLICSIVNDFGFIGKLTGFGGGFIYILLSPNVSVNVTTNAIIRLKEEGFNVITTSINCDGVRIN
ncbi:mevalonate kinase-like [Nylanderia fulva]|uniref:mevalonate kinase-like n=1 Tax=Nylanderia fulva TaxID=613905 RepID=UPI0010FB3D29|nr:mevalonate kinase-like [Nylanderia fulva]XP_029178964.1 mevalonate kinase-like [Nylanderia fulva]